MQSRWESAVSMKPSDPQILCGFATYLAKAGEYERAQEVYTRSLASDGTHLGSLCNYAVMLEARGNEEEACELYKRAIEADGGQVIALSNYGHLLCRNGGVAPLPLAGKRCAILAYHETTHPGRGVRATAQDTFAGKASEICATFTLCDRAHMMLCALSPGVWSGARSCEGDFFESFMWGVEGCVGGTDCIF